MIPNDIERAKKELKKRKLPAGFSDMRALTAVSFIMIPRSTSCSQGSPILTAIIPTQYGTWTARSAFIL